MAGCDRCLVCEEMETSTLVNNSVGVMNLEACLVIIQKLMQSSIAKNDVEEVCM